MPEEPDQQKAPSGRWRPNEFFRQSALEALRRNAGMSTGHARGEAVGLDPGGLDPFARRDLGRDLGRHLELSLNSFSRNLGRRIGITTRFLNSLPPIFHASTLDLPSLVDDAFRQVMVEIVDPSSEDWGPRRSPEPPVSGPDEDRPFGTYSSDSDLSDSDSACDKTEKPSQDSKPKTSQSSRHAGLGLADVDHSAYSTSRRRGSPTFRCSMPADLETLFEVDQSGSSDESDIDILSGSDLFHTDSSDEWEVNARKPNRIPTLRFQSLYSGPPNSEEEDGIEVLDVEVRDAVHRNVETGESEGAEGESPEESRSEVQSDAKEGIDVILEEEDNGDDDDDDDDDDDEDDEDEENEEDEDDDDDDDSLYYMEENLRSIEGENEGEDEDEETIEDEDKEQGRVGDDEAEEASDSDVSLEEEETEESVEDEYDHNSLDGEGCPSLQSKEPFGQELGYEFDDKDDTIEYDITDDSEPKNEEEEVTTEESQDENGDEDLFATVEELQTPDVNIVNE
ncbi:hypothetical protein R5R35_013972 [Gryllus longicercus]|uniref:Uncharacterized protein n=1 Tax=Gryllus longicercus TaxID=2509291 RepID=A0AAN9YWT7_9ORTH